MGVISWFINQLISGGPHPVLKEEIQLFLANRQLSHGIHLFSAKPIKQHILGFTQTFGSSKGRSNPTTFLMNGVNVGVKIHLTRF